MKKFLIAYIGTKDSNSFSFGNIVAESEVFPNKKEIDKNLKENFNINGYAITMIKELSKEEYENFAKDINNEKDNSSI